MLQIQQVDFPLAISGHAPAHNTQADYLIGKYVASICTTTRFIGFIGETLEEVQSAFQRELRDYSGDYRDDTIRLMQPHMVRKHLGEGFAPLPR